MSKRQPEKYVKTSIGNWLRRYGCEVYDEEESSKRPRWDGKFKVKNVHRKRKPDLVICCYLTHEGSNELDKPEYVAFEIKPGFRHQEITEGFGDILRYFADYCWGATYIVKPRMDRPREVRISVFALATKFSRLGFLYEGEKQFGRKPIKEIPSRRKLYPITYSLSRLLGSQRTAILNNIMSLVHIPEAKKRVRKGLVTMKQHPQVGVLTKRSTNSKEIQLMTSDSPYYFNVTPLEKGRGKARVVRK